MQLLADMTSLWYESDPLPLTYLWIWSQTGSDYQSVAQYSLVTTLSNELRTDHDHKSPLVICPTISKWCPPNWRPFPTYAFTWLDNVMIWHGVEGEVALGIERSRNFSVWILLDVYRSTSCHQLCCGKCCMQRHKLLFVLLHAVWSTCINHPELESETHCIMHGLYSHSCTCNVLYCSFAQYIYTCTYS